MSDLNGKASGELLPAKRSYRPMRLDDAEAAAPAPTGLGLWAEKLRAAAYNAVTEADVEAMIAAQVEKARAGDAAAAKFVIGFLAAPAPKVQVQKVVIRGRSKKRAADPDAVASPPVRHAEPNPTPALKVYRRLAAHFIHVGGPATVAAIALQLELPHDQVRAVIDCTWFQEAHGAIELTPMGRQVVA